MEGIWICEEKKNLFVVLGIINLRGFQEGKVQIDWKLNWQHTILSETKMGWGRFRENFSNKTHQPLETTGRINSIDASSETIHMTQDPLEGVANSRGFKLSPVPGAMLRIVITLISPNKV